MRDPYIYYPLSEGRSCGYFDYLMDRSAADDMDDDTFNVLAKKVIADIDTLTFNRITDYDALTSFQKYILHEVCLRMVAFNIDNRDILNAPLSSYSVNGVSMSFDSMKVKNIGGIYIPPGVYALLAQTGLVFRGI